MRRYSGEFQINKNKVAELSPALLFLLKTLQKLYVDDILIQTWSHKSDYRKEQS